MSRPALLKAAANLDEMLAELDHIKAEIKRVTTISKRMEQALRLTDGNLSSLIAARHCDAVLMTDWRKVVRKALNVPS